MQTVDTVYRADLLPPDFDENHLQLLVHSGSRGLGQQILQRHIAAFGHQGLAEEGEAAAAYLPNIKRLLNLPALTAVDCGQNARLLVRRRNMPARCPS